jgi:NifU-like protein involved in Fe-S cluster formation
MDEPVIRYYRKLLRSDFENIGELQHPSIFLDSIGEKVRICGQFGNYYLHLYIAVAEGHIRQVKYKCACDPTANVAIEILCGLLQDRSLEEAKKLSEESFLEVLGGPSPDLANRARKLMELLARGIGRFEAQAEIRKVD